MSCSSEISPSLSRIEQGICACGACGGADIDRFLRIDRIPVNCIALFDTRQAALDCPTGTIDLGFCQQCGAVSNLGFEISRLSYDTSYDNSLHFSPTFRRYADSVADYLIERYDLRGKTVIDVGCGNAEFLALLCERGGNRGVGFDPSFIAGRVDTTSGKGISIIRDYYSDAYRNYEADVVICRQVLEHIPQPFHFVRGLRAALSGKSQTAVFFEVPNAGFVFQKSGMWDVIYEHCFYYTAAALERLFSSCGFDVLEVRECFQGQYLSLEAKPSEQSVGAVAPQGSLGAERSAVLGFGEQYRASIAQWSDTLRRLTNEGKSIALWGAGAKGAMFLNAFRTSASLECIVDVNPHKHGRHIPGTGQAVVSPEFLEEHRPDVLLIMNPSYRQEIEEQVLKMGLRPELISI